MLKIKVLLMLTAVVASSFLLYFFNKDAKAQVDSYSYEIGCNSGQCTLPNPDPNGWQIPSSFCGEYTNWRVRNDCVTPQHPDGKGWMCQPVEPPFSCNGTPGCAESHPICPSVWTGGPDPDGDISCRLVSGWSSDGPCVIQSGSSTTIDWNTQNSSDCYVTTTGGFSGGTPLWSGLVGTESTGSLTASTTYYLHCEGPLGDELVDTVQVSIISANLQVSTNTANNAGPFVEGPLTVGALGTTVRLKGTCSTPGGSGRISPSNTNFAGTTGYVNVSLNVSPKTWTLTCYPSPNQVGTPTATDFVTVQLNTQDFTFTCNTLSKTVTAGSSTIFDTTATAVNGFNSPVTVSVTSGLPSGASSTPVTVTPTAVASVPVSTTSSTPAGPSDLTFTATGGGKTHTCVSQLIVTTGAPYLVSLSIAPQSSSILVGATQAYTSQASYSNGTNATVTNTTVFGSSDKNIASGTGAVFTGEADGEVTITGTYTEGAITVADTASLIVGDGDTGGLSASATCPSGAETCTIPYNTSINLTWTSSGATSCSMSPDLTPAVSAVSGTASTGNLTATTTFTLTCYTGGKFGTSVDDTVTVIVNPAGESFVNADKDITSVNSIAIGNGSCNGGTDPVTKTFATNDLVSFKINLCNGGSATASNLVIADELTNLAKPTAGWNAFYNGVAITPVESGTAPNKTLTFTLPGSINAGSTKSLTFDAVVTPPSPITNTIYRFQNIARISNTNGNWTASTPLYLFYAGSKVPSKQEVAP